MKFEFRTHHFLCTLGFEGKGYSPEFVAGYASIARALRAPEGDEIEIRVTAGSDSICTPCPNRRDEKCETETKIASLDAAHARVLGLRVGETLTWGEAKKKIQDKMTVAAFHEACATCSWRGMGMCLSALEKLRGER